MTTTNQSECGETIRMTMETGMENLICCLPADHDGEHYDDAFSRTWVNAIVE